MKSAPRLSSRFVAEAFGTFCLVFAGSRGQKLLAGVVVGGVIGLEALFAGPISGASMNPARFLSPAVVTLQIGSLWIYLLAPIVGAMAGVPLCRCLRPDAGLSRGDP
jgi:glycerol uptake facilitator-like aquaporin